MKCLVRLFLIFTFIFAFTPLLFSQNKGIGAGVILGEPTAISAKFWLGENNAVDAALGYSFDKGEKGIKFQTRTNFGRVGSGSRIPIHINGQFGDQGDI
mgnify:CR=1 FL=1